MMPVGSYVLLAYIRQRMPCGGFPGNRSCVAIRVGGVVEVSYIPRAYVRYVYP